MLKAFKQIPGPLQKQILYRLGYGIAALFVTIILFSYTRDLFSVLACIVIIIFFAANSFSLFRRAVIGDYVVISGECLAVTVTPVKRRIKTVILRTEDDRMINVTIRQKLKRMKAGTKIMFYVAANMPVYEKDGTHVLHSYLAIDIKTENKAE